MSLTRMPFCPNCITCELKINAFVIVGLGVGTWLIYQSVFSFKFFPFENHDFDTSMNWVWVLFTDIALTLASIVHCSFYWLLWGSGLRILFPKDFTPSMFALENHLQLAPEWIFWSLYPKVLVKINAFAIYFSFIFWTTH